MKTAFVATLAVLGAASTQAALTETVPVGFKSGTLEMESGSTAKWFFDVSDAQTFCSDLPQDVNCYVEVEYSKHASGTQSVCVGSEALNECSSAVGSQYWKEFGTGIATETRCQRITDWNSTDWQVTTTGVCDNTCISTTDAEVKGIRIFQSNAQSSNACPVTGTDTKNYVPFMLDSNGRGGNTAFYKLDASADVLAFPSMYFTAIAGDSLNLRLDVNNLESSKFAVQFQYRLLEGDANPCGTFENATSCAATALTSRSGDVFGYPTARLADDFSTGLIPMDAGRWAITPFVYAHDGAQTDEIEFRFCGGLNFECASAFAAAPSMMFAAVLAAVVAAFQRV